MIPICIPLVFGCSPRISPDVNDGPRICPRCHNAAMFAAKSRTWLEFCFVPLIPFKSRMIWMCSVCQLQTEMQPWWAPPLAEQSEPYGPYQNWFAPQDHGKPEGHRPGYTQE